MNEKSMETLEHPEIADFNIHVFDLYEYSVWSFIHENSVAFPEKFRSLVRGLFVRGG